MTTHDRTSAPLILFQNSPYAGSLARSSLDLALSFAVFAQQPALLFCGDAVLCLKDAQDSHSIGRKSLRKVIDSLPLYDIEQVYVDQLSLEQNGLGAREIPPFAVSVSTQEIQKMLAEAAHVISL
ncbi:DsrE/DsrF-like family protein [gamma proteobacterium NOR5-3]|nr:DsrE/DsrF-like family protein [gamma proteobacterium NOR5-3]